MKKVNLNAIANAFYEAKKNEISARAADYVREKIIPMLENAAKTGVYFCLVKIKDESLSWTEVQKEILAQADCRIIGEGRIFTVDWF